MTSIINIIQEEVNKYNNTMTLYHGTIEKHIPKIKQEGLKNKNQSPTWYMLATDMQSALFHASPEKNQDAFVIEFEVPVTNEKWEGYPYLWTPYSRNNESSWYAPKETIKPEFIKKIHRIPYEDYVQAKLNRL